jgi:hypothetical protein
MAAPLPCAPQDLSLPIYQIIAGHFLVDRTGGAASRDVSVLAAQASVVVNLIARVQGTQFSLDMAAASGPDADAKTPAGPEPWLPNYDPASLRLEITGVLDGLACLNLWNATNKVYAILTQTNLLTDGWQVESELWPTNGLVMPFTLPTLGRPSLMVRAMDWTGVDSDGDGVPDWWLWKYFGRLDLSATNVDSQGANTLLYDFTSGFDPNVISFEAETTDEYVNTTDIGVRLNVVTGLPSYYAVLLPGSTSTNWQPFTSTNLTIDIGPTDGVYTIAIGLKGLPPDAKQAWDEVSFTLDRVPPVVGIVSPSEVVVGKPYLQLKGWADRPLANISCDLSNAAGVVTGLDGFVTDQVFDPNRFDFTTNYFQVYDLPLTNGPNLVTLRLTSPAGNLTATNFVVTFDETLAVLPSIAIAWPQDGAPVSGGSFYVRGVVDDETAQVTAQVVDDSGATNVLPGTVERDGTFWIEGLPLSGSSATVTMTAVNAAGSMSTNLVIAQSSLGLTIDSTPTGDDLYQATGVVYGTVTDPGATVTVNGVAAMVMGEVADGVWQWRADRAPINGRGTATFDVTAQAGSGRTAAAVASKAVEMGPYAAIIKHVLSKSRDHRTWDGRRDHWETTKNYEAEYQGDASGQWGPKWFQGTRTDYNNWSEGANSGWTRDEIHWSNVSTNIHYSDSDGESYTIDRFQDAFSNEDGVQAGVPDQDLSIEGWLGPEGSSGSRPVFVYHYYARGLRYHWDLSNADTEDAKVTARTEMKLYTGGRAGLSRQSLVRVTAAAEENLEPPNGAWGDTPILPMDPARIKVLGWWLFGHGLQDPGGPYVDPDEIARHEGYRYAVLPDNSGLNLNLRAPSAKHYNARARVQKLRLNLRTVTFKGDNEPIPMLQDSNGLPYPSPQCTNDDNGPLLGYPVLYPSGSYVQTFTGFKETGGGHFPLVVKGEVSGGLTSFTLWATNWPDDDCQNLTAWTYADKPLTPNTVDFYKPMTIKWYYGWTDKPKMMYAGYSTNWVYVSLAQPLSGASLYHTVAHLACSHGHATDADDAAGNTWRLFSTGSGPSDVTSWDSKPLCYYKAGIPWADGTDNMADLLKQGYGQCNSLRELLESAWLVNGVVSAPATVTTAEAPGYHLFLVKHWSFSGPTGSHAPPYSYTFYLNAADGSMVGVSDFGDLRNDPGAPGQNSPTPAEKAFGKHFIQLLRSTYYDPSYGLTYSGEADFQSKAVEGFGVVDDDQPDPLRTRFNVKKVTSVLEIRITP